jgi:hypothetical protein
MGTLPVLVWGIAELEMRFAACDRLCGNKALKQAEKGIL